MQTKSFLCSILPTEMTTADRSDDDDLLVALRHPLRRRILRAMSGEDALSPRELAATLRAPLSNVAYHVRVLADCAAVVLVRTQPVRGSMQHFYLPAVEAPWARQILDLGEREDGERGENPGSPGT
jgi:DNA-binding transcriptional ArsR family regulator